MIEDAAMRFEEKLIFSLRSLYRKYGYLPYKMSKFEEYDLYLKNKDFLVSDSVITFSDTNGKLMALKPDVTLSIIKNGEDKKGTKQKLYYNENVYRISDSTHRFREIMQTGLECIGDIDIYDIYEAITLACASLAEISDRFVIEVSNMDIISSILISVSDDQGFITSAMNCISQKNIHELKKLCRDKNIGDDVCTKIEKIISLYGNRDEVIRGLEGICTENQISNLRTLSEMLDRSPFGDRIHFDFSIVSDMNYYNGFVFNGFVDGIYQDVLTGGQYDNMMRKMNRSSGAVGFALYLDRLENLNNQKDTFELDYLILYDDESNFIKLQAKVKELTDLGFSICCEKTLPDNRKYQNMIDLRKGEKDA